MNNRDIMRNLMQESYKWIMLERSARVLYGRRISEEDREKLRPYFTSGIVDRTRVAFVDRIDNPPFYARLKAMGVANPIDFTEMLGITFVDFIVISKTIARKPEERLPILFHELVHVLQYRALGPRRFIEQYLGGWFKNGGKYSAIPLEKQAYALQAGFERGERFSVEKKLGLVVLL